MFNQNHKTQLTPILIVRETSSNSWSKYLNENLAVKGWRKISRTRLNTLPTNFRQNQGNRFVSFPLIWLRRIISSERLRDVIYIIARSTDQKHLLPTSAHNFDFSALIFTRNKSLIIGVIENDSVHEHQDFEHCFVAVQTGSALPLHPDLRLIVHCTAPSLQPRRSTSYLEVSHGARRHS